MIAASEKYALEVSSPAPLTSERQHEEYLPVLDKLASKDHPPSEEEKYAGVLMTLKLPFIVPATTKRKMAAQCTAMSSLDSRASYSRTMG